VILDALGRPVAPSQSLTQILDQRAPFRVVTSMLRASGERLVARSGIPRFTVAGTFIGYRGTSRDATERVRIEREARAKVAAENASRSKTEFLSRISHELRTPLNAILGFGQLLLMPDGDALTERQRRQIETIRTAGQQLLSLINGVLDISKIEQGRLELRLQPVDVHELVRSTMTLLEPQATSSGIAIVNAAPPGLFVLAERRALGQVLSNLLSNAVKFNRPQGRVTVRTEAHERLALIVEDTGAGLTSEQMQHLFEPFHRLGRQPAEGSGSGLGLVISKALVEAMGGALSVSSAVGHGTAVRVSLPVADVDSVPVATATPGEPVDAVEPPPAVHRHVLYVEDDPVNVLLMRQLFAGEAAWELATAMTGEEGLAQARTLAPSLAVLDMNLPDMTGTTLMHRLVGEGLVAAGRCVALSADALPENIDSALQAGFSEYWTKPINVEAVRQRLRWLLRLQTTPDED
jgi:signal transduction histidine kinase/ActR/RegA family two-component response regulator